MTLSLAARERVEPLIVAVREIEDFPRKGIFTQDVSLLFAKPVLLKILVGELAALCSALKPDVVAGVYSRGYLLGAPLAHELGVPFVPIPKSINASPSAMREKYVYEYSKDELALEPGAFTPGQRVLVVDDQLATGGTMKAAISLVEKQHAVVVGCGFILIQTRYDGLNRLMPHPVFALFEK